MPWRAALETLFNIWGFLNLAAMFVLIENAPTSRGFTVAWIASVGAWLAIERFVYRRKQ